MFRRTGLIVVTILAGMLLTGLSGLLAGTANAATAAPPTNVAHRGASAYAPENTVAAFREAGARNADMFEIDVQETRDHKLVLMHDTTLARTTDAEQVFPGRSPWNVGDFTLAEIRRLDAGSWFGPEFAGEPVPTLHETLEKLDGAGMGLLLEMKSPELYPGIGPRVAKELLRHPSWSNPDPQHRRLVVQSFNWDFMRDFAPLLPEVPFGLLGTPTTAELPELATFAEQINPNHGDLTPAYVARVHELGMEVFTWTVDVPADMRRAIDLGADGIITNRPDVLSDVIGTGAQREAA